MKEIEKKLKAVANLRRLAILKFLKKQREATVQDIAEHLNLSFKATSRHLRMLFIADILEKEQRSVYVFYRLAPILTRSIRFLIDEL